MTSASEYEQQLIREIQNDEAYFDEDEVDSYSDEVLIAFANKRHLIVEYLPKNRMSYAVLKAVIENDPMNYALKYITSKDTQHYQEMATLAVSRDYTQLKHVEPKFVDLDLCAKILDKKPNSIYTFLIRYASLVEQLITPEELEDRMTTGKINRVAIIAKVIAGQIKTSLVTNAYIKESLLCIPHLMADTLKSEFKPLAMNLMTEGCWPADYASHKPSSLKDAVKSLKASGTSSVVAWHQAYIMSFGIEKVVQVMKAPRNLALLETLYSRDEIKPYLNGLEGNKAKGKWLEDEMGL
jgi:hypothetical protein